MDTQFLEGCIFPPMTFKIGLYHSGGKLIWMNVAWWANHLVTVCNSRDHSHITIVHSLCGLKGEYTSNEADQFSIADIPLGEEAWAPYLRQTLNSYRGDGASTEVIIYSNYNIWAMLQNPAGIESSDDYIVQDHMYFLTTNWLQVRILDQRNIDMKYSLRPWEAVSMMM